MSVKLQIGSHRDGEGVWHAVILRSDSNAPIGGLSTVSRKRQSAAIRALQRKLDRLAGYAATWAADLEREGR